MDVAIDYTIEKIAEIINGKLLHNNSGNKLSHLLLDSRKLSFPENTVFFALKNSHRNGEEFIEELYEKGVKNFVISNKGFEASQFKDANFILVDDVLKALQTLAAYHRKQFNLLVIGITGSNGKTIVKEWLYQLLENEYNIVRSPKSYNSQIGVPLSVLQLNKKNTLAIFEAGISQPGEMEKLERIIQPSIGVLTNIGDAHSKGFKSLNEKTIEKLKLFKNCDVLIYNKETVENNPAVNEQNNLIKENVHFFSWSMVSDEAKLFITSIGNNAGVTGITAIYNKKEISVTIPFIDEASIENAITCWCVLLHLNINEKIIAEKMLQLHAVEMRLELKHGINNCSIINDSYSSDISSLKIALDFLEQQRQHQKRTVILSDILQSGKPGNQLYAHVAALLKQKNIERLIAIGPQISLNQEQFYFLKEKHFFISVDEFLKAFNDLHFKDETILLKGARVFEFEQISHLLEQKAHQTVLSIDLNGIVHNAKQYQQLLQPHVKIMAMVKAFSYGSGSYEIANVLQFNKVDYLAVAYTDEGVELRRAGITLPIMVMNPEENTFSALLQYDLEPEIFSFSILSSLEKYLKASAINYFPVHIKLDTGMHRLGFEENDVKMLCDHLKDNDTIKLKSVFSHLVAAEDESSDKYTNLQGHIFLQCCEKIRKVLGYNFIMHIANTSAISRHKNLQLDMVRLGIGLYGIDSNIQMQKKLKNVSTLVTTIAQVKKVKAGESIGYGRKTIIEKDSTIATVRIGYADGYPRMLSNGIGKMLVQNKLVKVVGNVCMDMTMVDVTEIKNIKAGDEVIVFGEKLPIQQLAKWCGTISYEIMTGISQRVKRIYFEE